MLIVAGIVLAGVIGFLVYMGSADAAPIVVRSLNLGGDTSVSVDQHIVISADVALKKRFEGDVWYLFRAERGKVVGSARLSQPYAEYIAPPAPGTDTVFMTVLDSDGNELAFGALTFAVHP
jgi:hypothetical protein